MVEHQLQTYYVLLVTVNLTLIFAIAMLLAACLCCKRKVPKNDLLGLEGMVKLKNPDEVPVITTVVGNSESQADLNLSTTDSEKRASTAAHRSLPDIPVADANGDNGSELYETVAEKRLLDAQINQDKSPTPSIKKQISVSQHSSISQADDVSSPYSRVKNSPHDYAKVRNTEHPYAQLNAPSTSAAAAATAGNCIGSQLTLNSNTLNRNSHHSSSSQAHDDLPTSQAEIPAASAIAGMISASQDLPYMTPPIANQHFSGDSQDSSKGYTSISVREPLANILAQQPSKSLQRNAPLARDVNDSHYATVSDDSDETYAAIEDPNMRNNSHAATDIYTSGSETYAQIQPMQPIVVSVEINNSSASNAASAVAADTSTSSAIVNVSTKTTTTQQHKTNSEHSTPVPPPVDSLRSAQMHSRQASSSSNNSSSVGNLGSPKPEKRQANSPLPPTPKSNTTMQQHIASSSSSLTSGRNSVISVIECGSVIGIADANEATATTAITTNNTSNGSPQKKKKSLSPSKDIEGMYAKVMKKNKFSRNSPSSQSNSPILSRKHNEHAAFGVSALDAAAAELMDAHKIAINSSTEKNRTRSNSYGAKDHGYETIPADTMRNSVAAVGLENRKSDCYANILQKERQQQEGSIAQRTKATPPPPTPPTVIAAISTTRTGNLDALSRSEKHYETIPPHLQLSAATRNSDPGYETLNTKSKCHIDPDTEKKSDYDPNYEVLKDPNYANIKEKATTSNSNTNSAGLSDDGYAKVIEKKRNNIDEDSTDGYSKVKAEYDADDAVSGYSTIREPKGCLALATDANHNYASILEAKGLPQETDSDHYARIAETQAPTPPPDLPHSSSSNLVLTPTRNNELPHASPSSSSLHSTSMLNNSSAASSTTNFTTTSTTSSTLSSHQTQSISSQYESLTGSDTDPNYESVCYINSSSRSENPYERLQTDYSDMQLSSSSPLTPSDERSAGSGSAVAPKTISNGRKVNADLSGTTVHAATEAAVVDDYFQV